MSTGTIATSATAAEPTKPRPVTPERRSWLGEPPAVDFANTAARHARRSHAVQSASSTAISGTPGAVTA
jgi:hypothetical protein